MIDKEEFKQRIRKRQKASETKTQKTIIAVRRARAEGMKISDIAALFNESEEIIMKWLEGAPRQYINKYAFHSSPDHEPYSIL